MDIERLEPGDAVLVSWQKLQPSAVGGTYIEVHVDEIHETEGEVLVSQPSGEIDRRGVKPEWLSVGPTVAGL